MLLRNLFEATGKKAVFALGRLNPATIGHARLVDSIKEQDGDPFLFLTDRPAKLPNDPLDPMQKLQWAQSSFDGVTIKLAKNIATAAHQLYKLGYEEITFLEGEPKLYNILKDYNGKFEGKKGPIEFPFKFEKINYIRLERDADDDGAAGMSATKLRSFAQNNDKDKFTAGITDKAKPKADILFKTLQGAMGIDPVEENVNELNLFKLGAKVDNKHPLLQDPNKIKVMTWIADRVDGKEHFLSFYKPGTAFSGNLLYISPNSAKKFLRVWDTNPDHHDRMKKAFTSVQTTSNLFKNLDIKHSIKKFDKR